MPKYIKFKFGGKTHFGRVVGQSFDAGRWYRIKFISPIKLNNEYSSHCEVSQQDSSLKEITQKEFLLASVLES